MVSQMEDEIRILASLSNAFSPPGSEDEVREILRRELEKYADEIKVDKLGNIFFHHYGREGYPKIMLAAHMDEVAIIVTHIDKNGFLHFHTLGGIVSNVMPGQRIILKGDKGYVRGVVGMKPPHLMKPEERGKAIPMEELFIDIGAGSLEEVEERGITLGSTGVFDMKFTELEDGYLMGKAFDDRAGCTVMVEVFKALKDTPYNFVAVGTVQEEVGLRGAQTAAWQIEPDYGLALEGTFANDVPGTRPNRLSAKLRGGPVITIVDRRTITHPKVLKTLIDAGKEIEVPFQFKKIPSGGTDAGAIHLTKSGVPSGTVAVPCRYIHGPAAITHIEDLKNTIKLVAKFVEKISKKSE
ncbi:MAG TPA: M42 family peptidase [Candidatus Bathyarchaeota archaeon]|nr:M42 family peptidase [Candidatus Bathyarchaeota archaeon]